MAPNQAQDGEILTLDLPPGLSLGDLKGFVTAETDLPQTSQHFFLNNNPLQGDNKTLEEMGVGDGDMMAMLVRPANAQPGRNAPASSQPANQQQPQQQRRQQQQRAPDRRGDAQQAETTRLSILGNPAAMAQVREQRPALADALNDPDRFRAVWEEMMREQQNRNAEREEQIELLNQDPFNEEAQRKIEEIIRQETVQENLQFAYEHNPEVFGRVTMLYIPVEVNRHPVKAFVDSGAQTTIMSPSCAESCGIMRLIDKRYSGIARGVGTAQILGRVHSADIKIGNDTMGCSFTVMEGKDVDLLLGLDMLKRFQAIIDLKQNKLIFGDGNEVSFLGEADIPKDLEAAHQSEPTISGPNGTEIGTQSGTVKPAGTSTAAAAAAASSSSSRGAFKGQGQTLGSASSAKPPTTSGATVDPPATATNAGPVSPYPQEAVELLQNLGFSRQQAIGALDACGGDVDYAASMLFQS